MVAEIPGDVVFDNKTSIDAKALRINLNQFIYGTFAEIGAGQEVARHFFRVGGASGTIAKSVSAYDKHISDTIYGEEDDIESTYPWIIRFVFDKNLYQLFCRLLL